MDKLVTCCFLEFTKQLRENKTNTLIITPNAQDNEINLMMICVANSFAFFMKKQVVLRMSKIKYLWWRIRYNFTNQRYKNDIKGVEIIPCEFAHTVCKNTGVGISTFTSAYKEYYKLQTKRSFLKWKKS